MDFKLNKSNLNFRAYTAAALPNTAQENDICIISDVPMKNWILSPDAPGGAPRTDGDVWIQYSVCGNTFNALKNGVMMIATISVWQYIDDVWTEKTANSYHAGEWVAWIAYLYADGNEYTEFTGGWEQPSISYVTGGTTRQNTGTVTKRNNGILLTAGGESIALISTKKKIQFGGKTKLYVTADTSYTSSNEFGIIRENSGSLNNIRVAYKTLDLSSGTFELEIPSGVNEGYLYVMSNGGSRTVDFHVMLMK